MEIKQLTQNVERYSVTTNPNSTFMGRLLGGSSSSKKWIISASEEIEPIVLNEGDSIEFIPLLEVDGIVVKVAGLHLISKVTLNHISDYNNPHYAVVPNGIVNGAQMGKTIPIIELDITGLGAIGESRDASNRFAGVKSVDYGYETEPVNGIPKGLLDQINYTLKETGNRPADRFSIWDLGLTGDYSIDSLKIETAQEDGSLDQTKLDSFVIGVADRLKVLRGDFNSLKEIFYNGATPANSSNSYSFNKVANVEDMDDEKKRGEKAVVIKTADVVSVQPTPSQLAVTTTKSIQTQTADIKTQIATQGDTTDKQSVELKKGLAGLMDRLKTAGIK